MDTQSTRSVEERIEEFEATLDAWLGTTDHKYQCIAHSEGQCCCLDHPTENMSETSYGVKGRDKLMEIVRTTLKAVQDGERERINSLITDVFAAFNGYEVANANDLAEAAQEGAELFLQQIKEALNTNSQ